MLTERKSLLIKRFTSFSMLLVLLTHNVITSDTFLGDVFYVLVFRTFTRIAVPVFFAVSSFLLFHNYNYTKIWKRTKTLFFPFIIWSVISYCIFAVFPLLPFLKPFFNTSVSLTISGFVESVFISPKNGSLWFLRDLYILVLLSPIIQILLRFKKISYFVCVSLAVIWLGDLNYSFMVESAFFFFLGALIANNLFFWDKEAASNRCAYLCVILYAVFLCACSYISVNYSINPMIITKISILIGLPLLLYVKKLFLVETVLTRFLDWFKKYSFFLFVTNSIILSFTKKNVNKFNTSNTFLYCYTPLFCFFCVVVGYRLWPSAYFVSIYS